jgi:hypothetical protein
MKYICMATSKTILPRDSEKEQLDFMDACFNTTHWHDVIRL